MSSHHSNSGLTAPTHSILKKTHPASVISTPRSRSPVSVRDGALLANSNQTSGSSSSGSGGGGSGVAGLPHSAEVSYTPTMPLHPSPLRTQATPADDDAAAAAQPSVTFSMPSQPPSSLQVSTAAANEAVPPSQPGPTSSPLASILKPPSRRNSVNSPSDEHGGMDTIGSSAAASDVLSLPSFDSNQHPGTGEHSPYLETYSGLRSASPGPGSLSYDRTRVVGKGGYGGRRGGPALNKNRTSSSGGLSDVDMRPGYDRKVGFDTMIDADDTPNGYFTFCLQVKSHGYMRTKNTRTFMCACDDNGYSERALEWLMESLVSDGDEIVALRVLEGDPDAIDQDAARDDARELMASIVELNDEYGDRSISIVVEFVAGRVTSTILALIYMYRPDSITVGTRGRSMTTFQKMLGGSFIGSCSRDILNTSPVPVVIVRPEAKVKKHLAKRQNDPKRRSYHDLVALSKEDHLPLSIGSRRKSLQVPSAIKH